MPNPNEMNGGPLLRTYHLFDSTETGGSTLEAEVVQPLIFLKLCQIKYFDFLQLDDRRLKLKLKLKLNLNLFARVSLQCDFELVFVENTF